MILDDRLNIRIPKKLKEKFLHLVRIEGYERPSTALRDVIRQVVFRGYSRLKEVQHERDE